MKDWSSELRPFGFDGAGRQLYINRAGQYCTTEGHPTGWLAKTADVEQVWGSSSSRRIGTTDDELADLVKVYEKLTEERR